MSPPNLKILAYEDTDLGPLCLRRRELLSEPGTVVTEVTLNHEFLMSSYNTDSERAISNRSAEIHGGSNLKALVGGFGLGYTAKELLTDPCVASVEVIEYLPQVLQWLKEGLIPLSDELNDADGLRLTSGDVYQYLLDEPQQQYDLIVIDVDHSPADQLGSEEHVFYSKAGLKSAKKHLADGGILAVWSYAESSCFSEALELTFSQTHVEPVRTFNPMVQEEQTDWLFFGVK
ncbi:spermidine synthase [bacterium]|jgi:spermidine synthase|nr:spermidine synthase [bacterium]